MENFLKKKISGMGRLLGTREQRKQYCLKAQLIKRSFSKFLFVYKIIRSLQDVLMDHLLMATVIYFQRGYF